MSIVKWNHVENFIGIDKKIMEVENFFCITFPSDFIQCIKENNAGYPKPNCFCIDFRQEMINDFLTFDLDSKYSIINIFNMLKSRLPDKVIPIARDPFGNYICFDYRKSDNPILVFWIHEMESTIKKVCDTFTELLDMLEEFEEEEIY